METGEKMNDIDRRLIDYSDQYRDARDEEADSAGDEKETHKTRKTPANNHKEVTSTGVSGAANG